MRWDYYSHRDDISEEELSNLSSEELQKRKANTTEKNAWRVAEEVCVRIDDAKGPAGDFLKAYVTERPGKYTCIFGSMCSFYAAE